MRSDESGASGQSIASKGSQPSYIKVISDPRVAKCPERPNIPCLKTPIKTSVPTASHSDLNAGATGSAGVGIVDAGDGLVLGNLVGEAAAVASGELGGAGGGVAAYGYNVWLAVVSSLSVDSVGGRP